MVVSTLKTCCITFFMLLVVQISAGQACFGPKLFVGVGPGLEGEMRYHLVAIYLHEKTGIDSKQVLLKEGQNGLVAIEDNEIDLGFAPAAATGKTLLRLGEETYLYSGDRPLNDLQFSTVGRAFVKLQKMLDRDGLTSIRQAIKTGILPAVAVRSFMLEQGWI